MKKIGMKVYEVHHLCHIFTFSPLLCSSMIDVQWSD